MNKHIAAMAFTAVLAGPARASLGSDIDCLRVSAAGDILAKTNALKAAAAAESSVNAALWRARQAALDETDPGRKARLLKELDREIDAVLDASGKKLEARPGPLPPLAYDPREIRVEVEGKDIRLYHKEPPLATLRVGGAMTGRHYVAKLAGYLEAARRRAAAQGLKVSIDDKAVALYNETGFFNRLPLEEPERFGAILRITDEAALSVR